MMALSKRGAPNGPVDAGFIDCSMSFDRSSLNASS